MAESRQKLEDVLGLQGKEGGISAAHPHSLPTTPSPAPPAVGGRAL